MVKNVQYTMHINKKLKHELSIFECGEQVIRYYSFIVT